MKRSPLLPRTRVRLTTRLAILILVALGTPGCGEGAADYYNRGLTYQENAQYDEAIANYTRAIEINPRYAEAYNNRGNASADCSVARSSWGIQYHETFAAPS